MLPISVVIPTYNRVGGLERTLTALEDQQPRDFDFEVVVVDDGSKDDTAELLASWRARRFNLRFNSQTNQGPAAARNRALELASGELVLFGGDDIEPHPEQVWEHVREHARRADPRAAVLGLTRWPEGGELTSTMVHIDGPGAQQFSYHAFTPGAEYDFRHFYTSNVSLPRALMQQEPTGFSTAFRWAAFEDAEFAYRLANRGMRIFYHPGALAWHHHHYDARGFCVRQNRCGEMADVLVRLHPQLAKWVDLSGLEWQRISLLTAGEPFRRKVVRVLEDLDRWEGRSIDLAVALDSPTTQLADTLLHPLFRYAFVRGLARARLGEEAGNRVSADLWLRLIPPAVDVLGRQAAAAGLPLPTLDVESILSVGSSNRSRTQRTQSDLTRTSMAARVNGW
jgi:glycosyltransferase involved in cell wall biosynthesis